MTLPQPASTGTRESLTLIGTPRHEVAAHLTPRLLVNSRPAALLPLLSQTPGPPGASFVIRQHLARFEPLHPSLW